MNKLIGALILIALAVGFTLFLIYYSIPKSERNECLEWKVWEVENNYKPLEWQVEQCSHYNLNFKP
jgi:hypothetical protein